MTVKPDIEDLGIDPSILLIHKQLEGFMLVVLNQQGWAAFPINRSGTLMLPVMLVQALMVTRSLIFFLPSAHFSNKLAKVFCDSK